MTTKRTVDVIPILGTAILGLMYVFFFGERDLVLLVIFGLQIFRCGLAFWTATQKG